MGTSPFSHTDAVALYKGVLHRAKIPPRYFEYTITGLEEDFKGTEKEDALTLCKHFASHGDVEQRGIERTCLMLSGEFGTGKTTLATATAKAYVWGLCRINEPCSLMWLKFYDFVRHVQSGYSDGTADERISEVQQADILLLDDVGDLERGTETDNKRDLFYQVIDHRNDYLRPTIITSNLSSAEMATQFGQRTFERIMEMCALVKVEGHNLRMEVPS